MSSDNLLFCGVRGGRVLRLPAQKGAGKRDPLRLSVANCAPANAGPDWFFIISEQGVVGLARR